MRQPDKHGSNNETEPQLQDFPPPTSSSRDKEELDKQAQIRATNKLALGGSKTAMVPARQR